MLLQVRYIESSGLNFFSCVCIIALLYAVFFGIYCEILLMKKCILNDNDEIIMREDLMTLMIINLNLCVFH